MRPSRPFCNQVRLTQGPDPVAVGRSRLTFCFVFFVCPVAGNTTCAHFTLNRNPLTDAILTPLAEACAAEACPLQMIALQDIPFSAEGLAAAETAFPDALRRKVQLTHLFAPRPGKSLDGDEGAGVPAGATPLHQFAARYDAGAGTKPVVRPGTVA